MGKTWIRSDDVAWEELGSEILLVHARTGARWILNATAAAVWQLCDGRRELAEAAAFCSGLRDMGLLREATCPQIAGAPVHFSAVPELRVLNASGNTRRRPTPRGVSGPI